MLLESGLLLVLAKLSVAGENCTDTCLECSEGICLKCEDGYYGRECEVCRTHCTHWGGCEERVCPFGCLIGWYGLQCDVRCADKCVSGRCEQYYGVCYDLDGCEEGVCTYRCDMYCHQEDDKTEEDSEMALPSEIIIVLVVGFLILVVGSCCCVMVYAKKPNFNVQVPTQSVPRMDIIPSGQRLLPGQQPGIFNSSNRTHSSFSLSNAYLDSNNVLQYSGNASDDVIKAGTSPPAYEDNTQSPPAYDVLFTQTAPSSGECV